MTESELKLILDPQAAAALRRHQLLAAYAIKRPWTRTQENRYVDTLDLTLRRHHLELRLRRVGSRWMQTLKSGSTGGAGVRVREEWETALNGPAFDLDQLRAIVPAGSNAAQALRQSDLAASLHELVRTHYKRTTWTLLSAKGDRVEVALDIGHVEGGRASQPIVEVELELKSGREQALHELALALAADLPLRLGGLGKADRGFALLRPESPGPVGASRVKLKSAMSAGAALFVIVHACLAQVQANEAGVLLANQPECVHQMRVGLRRLRVALQLFEPLAQLPDELFADVRWAADTLAPARDWDVLADSTLSRLPRADTLAPAREALRRLAQQRAADARAHSAAALATTRHTRWQLALMAWACEQRARKDFAVELPAFARAVLGRRRTKFLARGRHMVSGSEVDRHRARIAAKKLRYALEFFESIADGASPRRQLRALSALQGTLGTLNDVAVANSLLAQLAQQNPQVTDAAAWARGWLCAESAQQLRQLETEWRRISKDFGKP